MNELTLFQYCMAGIIAVCLGFLLGFAIAFELWGNNDER